MSADTVTSTGNVVFAETLSVTPVSASEMLLVCEVTGIPSIVTLAFSASWPKVIVGVAVVGIVVPPESTIGTAM